VRDTAEFVVLGAGPAGLGAAWKLARAGRSVVVLEQADQVGGLSGSFDVAGVRVDHGSHRLHPNTRPDILRDLRSLLGDDLQLRPRHGRIRMSDTFVPFPPSPLGMLRNLPKSTSVRLARDVAFGFGRRSATTDTFAAVVRAQLGPTLLEEFYAPLVEKLFGAPVDALHGDLARRRVSARGGRDLLRKALRRGEQGNVFWYPRRGYGQISEALADAAVAAGAHIELGARVDRIDLESRTVEAGGRRCSAGSIWSTLPLPLLARLAGGPTSSLRFRAMSLVYLVLDRPRWSEFDAHYLVPRSVPITRMSEPRNYRSSTEDPVDRTVLCAEWPGFVDDEVWRRSPDDLADEIRESLARESLDVGPPTHVEVHRVPHAYPVYDLDFVEAADRLNSWAEAIEPIVLSFGRNGLFAHDNAHHALATAYAAFDAISTDGSFDLAHWRRAKSGFATHVVED
jgi:protoporphyrinogen oxidase